MGKRQNNKERDEVFGLDVNPAEVRSEATHCALWLTELCYKTHRWFAMFASFLLFFPFAVSRHDSIHKFNTNSVWEKRGKTISAGELLVHRIISSSRPVSAGPALPKKNTLTPTSHLPRSQFITLMCLAIKHRK